MNETEHPKRGGKPAPSMTAVLLYKSVTLRRNSHVCKGNFLFCTNA
jgi:hypothetical protein